MIHQYLESSFKRYDGKEQHFTLCITSDASNTEKGKVVGVGVAMCNYGDKYDKDLGRQIARERSMKDGNRLTMTLGHNGLINKAIASSILENVAKYIKNDPEFAIRGYHERMKRYQKRKVREKLVSRLKGDSYNVYLTMKRIPEKDRKAIIKLFES